LVADANIVKTTRHSNMTIGRRGVFDNGGTLTLTDEILTFVPNATNFGLGHGFTLRLADITVVEPVRAILFGFLPSPWSNGMLIGAGAAEYVVRVWGQKEWLQAIELEARRAGSVRAR
jgi:hypothetical protein